MPHQSLNNNMEGVTFDRMGGSLLKEEVNTMQTINQTIVNQSEINKLKKY